MTDVPNPPEAAPTTVGVLREAHVALMREWRVLDDNAVKAGRAAALRETIRHAGCDIADPAERDEAQGLLDYWISAVAALPEQAYPKLETLDPYVGAAGERAGASARQVYQDFGSEDERRVARAVFEDLLTKGPQGVERCAAQSRATFQQRIGGKNVDAVLAAFEATGAIARRPGATTAEDLFEATDANLVNSWPELSTWLDNREAYTRRREILLNRAEQWLASGRSRAFLASGEDLREIDRFVDETETLNEYIKASKLGSRKFRSIAITAAAIAAVVFAVLGWQAWLKVNAQRDRATFEAEANKAKADALKAELAAQQAINTARQTKEDYNLIAARPTDQALAPKQSDASPMPLSTLPRLGLPTLEGAIWLGNDTRPQVAAPEWGTTATAPSRAQAGTPYRVLADINLREGLPTIGGGYVSQRQKAVIRAGTLLVLTGKPQAYERPTGRQYWAAAQVVPRIYIQYTGGSRAQVERLRKRLSEAGFDVPAAEAIDTARGKREVRYFDQADRPIAALLLQRIGTGAGGDLGCRSFDGSRASNRYALEIWIDFRTSRPSEPATCE